jgi:hypothetical protein
MTGWNTLTDEIPQSYLDELSAKAPSIPLAMFRFAVSRYIDGDTADKPATVRDELDTLADASIRLAAMIAELSLAASEKLALAELRHGCEGLGERLKADLRSLMGIAEMARRDAEGLVTIGRSLSPNTQLVRDLARGLRMAGGAVDARPNGELVQSFWLALRVAGKDVADPAGTVKSALRTIGKE